MFTWWKKRKNTSSARNGRYLPMLENLEGRETPTVAVNVGTPINVSQAIGNQKDPVVIINPANTDQVVCFANNEDFDGDGVSDAGMFEAWSTDGGQSWTTQYLFTDPAALDRSTTHMEAAWDRFGNLFVAYKTGDDDVAVAYSLDGGQSFFSQVLTADGLNAQVSISTGPSYRDNLASVWICWHVDANPAGAVAAPHLETMYAWTGGLGVISPFTGRFGFPDVVPGSDQANAGVNDISVGPRGRVMVTYQSAGGPAAGPSVLWSNVDPDGFGPAGWGPRRFITGTNVGPARLIPANGGVIGDPVLTATTSARPNVSWDYSIGAHRGRAYFTYVDAPTVTSNDTNVFLRFSDNNGVTWSAPVRVNNDSGNRSQFLPALAVDISTGQVAVAWYDARNSSTNTITQVFAAVSDDGGATFGNNFIVSAHLIDVGASLPPATGAIAVGVGVYSQISFVLGNLQVVWSDNSTTLPGNPDLLHLDTATARVRVAPIVKVKVIFPVRWRLIDSVNRLYYGRLTILNTSGFDLRGPFTLTMTLPDSSLSFLAPPNTKTGNVVTFTINADLGNRVPLRLFALLFNPLNKKLPSSLIGYATSIA